MPTDVRGWLADVAERMERGTVGGLQLGAYYLLVGLWLTVSSRVPVGRLAYDHDWDLLVVLDACRTDALWALAEEYEFLNDRTAVWSPGSTSGEWVAHTFDRAYAAEIADTAYVTANPHSEEVLRNRVMPPQYVAVPATWPAWDPVEPAGFGLLDEVWHDATDDRLGVVPPKTLTDRAIVAGREENADRLAVHYMQPHAPYLTEGVTNGDLLAEPWDRPFEALQRGVLDRQTVWERYLENLRLVLDEVAVLLENVDAETVAITADHGEAFGEWGFYEHPVCCPHPAVKRVPWVETTAVDCETRIPGDDGLAERRPDSEEVRPDVASRLRDLGYR